MIQQIRKNYTTEIASIPTALAKSYFPALDGLRGIAILTVVIGHVTIGTAIGKYFKGNIGVNIFYVLSGFLITTLLLKEKIKTGEVSLKHFYIRRALRILPVAYLFLAVLALLNWLLKLDISAVSFYASLFYTRNLPFNYGPGTWYNGHFYTLAVEEQFYLFFPVLIVYRLRYYVRVVCFLIPAIPVLNYLIYNNVGIFYTNMIIHKSSLLVVTLFGNDTISILIGTLLSILIFKRILPLKKGRNYFLSMILFLVAITFRNSGIISSEYLNSLIFSMAIALVIYLCIDANDLLSTLLKNKVLVKIGILSYSIYIWQQLFTKFQPWGGLFKYADSPLLNIPILFIVAALSYYFYERRFLNLKDKFK